MTFLEREVSCSECGEHLDYERRPASLRDAADDLLLMAETVEDHRQETGCPADGEWRVSEWREL